MEVVLEYIGKGINSFEELLSVTNFSEKELKEILNKLENAIEIKKIKNNKYRIINFQMGQVFKFKTKYYVKTENGNYLLENIPNNIESGDIVSIDANDHNKICSIIHLLDKHTNGTIGIFLNENGKNYVISDSLKILIDEEISNIKNGQLITFEKKEISSKIIAKNVKLAGDIDDPYSYVVALYNKYHIKYEFSEEALKQAYSIKQAVDEEDLKNAVDLRNLKAFTIDCNDSKDFDDGLIVEDLKNGNKRIIICIANIPYYIKKGSYLDIEANMRTTSHYLGKYVNPMYPEILSNGILSLNPNVDRMVKAQDFEMDKDGNVINYSEYDAVINSKCRMKYSLVNEMFDGKDNYSDFKNELYSLRDTYLKLNEKRKTKGYLNFDINENCISYNNNDILDINIRDRKDAEKLIEEYMLLAGYQYANNTNKKCIYRVQPSPSFDKLSGVIKQIADFEKIKFNCCDITQKSISDFLKKISNSSNYQIYAKSILVKTKKAFWFYKPNIHHALNFIKTSQITSPIRRVTDGVNQRLRNGEYYSDNELKEICYRASLIEKKAKRMEYEYNDHEKALFMSKQENKTYNGKIVGASGNSLQIEFYNGIIGLLDTKGKIKVENLFNYKTKNGNYKVGDTINITINSIDLNSSKIKVKKI